MIGNAARISSENKFGKELYEKINWLSSELTNKKLLDKCNASEKNKILFTINEIKYGANRIKNSRFNG